MPKSVVQSVSAGQFRADHRRPAGSEVVGFQRGRPSFIDSGILLIRKVLCFAGTNAVDVMPSRLPHGDFQRWGVAEPCPLRKALS